MEPQQPTASNILSAENPIAPEPKKSSAITTLSVAIFILLALGVIAFLYYQNQQLKSMLASYQTQATPTSSATALATADPTANWKTYIASDNTFSFKYPEIIVISEKIQGKEMITAIKGLSTDILLVSDPITDHNFYLGKKVTDTIEKNGIKWNYLTGSIQQCDAGECGTISDALQTTTTNKRYSIVLGKLIYPDEKLNQILSTFKFLGKSATPSSSLAPSLQPQ